MRDELLKGLTKDQIAKVKECGDIRDLLQLAKDEGVELNEEQLDAINGGCGENSSSFNKAIRCSSCHASKEELDEISEGVYKCRNCGKITIIK